MLAQLRARALTALFALITGSVLLATCRGPANADGPVGVVTETRGSTLIVRTADGHHHTIPANDAGHCTTGTTYPACLDH